MRDRRWLATLRRMSNTWTGGGRAGTQVDHGWWTSGAFESRPMLEILHARDVGALFRFLSSRGWSRAAISGACGLSENRVRALINGQQLVTSFEVLERVADGLGIDRGLVGLAYINAGATGAGD